jgi:hypothetical protein
MVRHKRLYKFNNKDHMIGRLMAGCVFVLLHLVMMGDGDPSSALFGCRMPVFCW